jgi:transposase-like protein
VWVTWEDRWVSTATASYKGHRYPLEIINHCVWLYFRFPLSFREVEELMLVVRRDVARGEWSRSIGGRLLRM